jgi:cephalosporin-C deacetylase-like acetyl esterase
MSPTNPASSSPPPLPFNATTFWDTEKSRVESTPLNIMITNQNTSLHGDITLNRTDIAFDTPNWVDASPATLRVHGTLFTPTNGSGSLSLMPGVIVVHGTGQRRQDYFNASMSYAALDCAVLVIDLVGHGESQGPKPDAVHTLFQGDFNKTSYHYLAFCNGIQSVRALRSFASLVDVTRVAITGHSLGGMTSMVVSAVYHDKIALCLPSGMINITCTFPETSVLNLVNMTYDEMLALPLDTWKWIDPLNYMNMAGYPETCPFVGTNDEYFSYTGINDVWMTLQASPSEKWLQITPNGHHRYPASQTPRYLLAYKFLGGPAPPSIAITRAEKVSGVLEQFQVEAAITSSSSIAKVELCYKYTDIMGDPWRTKTMTLASSGLWFVTIDTPWITSGAACFVKVTLDAGSTIWFTSNVIEVNEMSNFLSFFPVIGIIGVLAVPIFIVLRYRYRVEVACIDEKHRKHGKQLYIAENLLVSGTEILKYSSFTMSWLNYSPTLTWSMMYIMQNYFTYDGALRDLAFYFNGALIMSLMVISITSVMNPLVSGLLNLSWPVLFYLLAGMLARSLGTTMNAQLLGAGYYVFIVVAFAQVTIWVLKRLYHKRLGIPTRNLVTALKERRTGRKK